MSQLDRPMLVLIAAAMFRDNNLVLIQGRAQAGRHGWVCVQDGLFGVLPRIFAVSLSMTNRYSILYWIKLSDSLYCMRAD